MWLDPSIYRFLPLVRTLDFLGPIKAISILYFLVDNVLISLIAKLFRNLNFLLYDPGLIHSIYTQNL